MRLIRRLQNDKAILVIVVREKTVKDILKNIKFDKAGVLGFVTNDGKEITANGNEETAKKAESVLNSQEIAVKNTTNSYQNINESVEKLMIYLNHISENVENMEESRVSTLGAIENISAVLEEIAASSNTVNMTASEQLNSVEVLNKSSGILNENAGELLLAVQQFTI